MTKYELWDRKTPINGVAASYFLNKAPFKNYTGDIILIYGTETSVSNVECKEILASLYDIDVNLPIAEFMSIYEEKTNSVEPTAVTE